MWRVIATRADSICRFVIHVGLGLADRHPWGPNENSALVRIDYNAGNRVPTLLFCAEDFELVSYLGDRTLTRYRSIAAQQLGAACPLPGAHVPEDELATTLNDWLNEFERVQLLLRLSPRLRQKQKPLSG